MTRKFSPNVLPLELATVAVSTMVVATLLLGAMSPARAQDGGESTPVPATLPQALPVDTLPSVTRVVGDIMRAEKANNASDLVLAYGQAVRDPQLAKGALSALLYDFYRLRTLAGSAMQVSQAVDETSLRFAIFQAAQNQVNVQQNQQELQQNQKIIDQNETLIKQNELMINLLDQIARKK